MLVDRNGFFWAKNKQTYTRIDQDSISYRKSVSQINQELAEYESLIEITGKLKTD